MKYLSIDAHIDTDNGLLEPGVLTLTVRNGEVVTEHGEAVNITTSIRDVRVCLPGGWRALASKDSWPRGWPSEQGAKGERYEQ